MDNGVIRIHPLTPVEGSNDYCISESLQDYHWSISIHDNDIGRVIILSLYLLYKLSLINR